MNAKHHRAIKRAVKDALIVHAGIVLSEAFDHLPESLEVALSKSTKRLHEALALLGETP